MTTARLNYELCGPAGAPWLLLAGSLGTTMAMWDPQLPALTAKFRVLRADPRGHGASEVPAGPYTIADIAGDLLALLDMLEIGATAYCGLSLGGMAGMWLASHAPHRIGRLALCCTSAWLPPADGWIARAAQVRAHGTASIRDQAVARWFTPQFREHDPATAGWAAQMLAATPAEGYAACCEAIAAMDLRPDLAAIAAPTLVIAGLDDPATPPEHGEAIAAAIAGARTALVPGAHLANVEARETVTGLLIAHLAG
jgi:3-oxoadipate enol-lactonase